MDHKKIFIVVPAITLLFAISCGHKKEEALKKTVATAKVERKNISKEVMLTGSIEAKDHAQIFPRGPGKVVKRLLKDGDPVKKNQPILLTMRDEVGFTFKPAPVVSTIDGFVGRIFVDVGSTVETNTPVATVVGPDEMRVKIDVPETYLPDVEIGKKIPFNVDSFPGDSFDGVISSCSKDIDIHNRSARVELLVDNPERKLVHGMFAKFDVPIETHKDVPVVPLSAVSWEAENEYVYKVESSKIKKTGVKTGLRNTVSVEVLEGLNEGDVVAIEGLIGLKEGETVETK